MNQGETIALIAAAPVIAQPAPLSAVAANNCQGAAASAQPSTPSARQHAAQPRDARHAEAAMDGGQVGDDEGAQQEVAGDGGRDERDRPAPRLMHREQEDGWAIEADAPAEDGDGEGGPDDAPAGEGRWGAVMAVGTVMMAECSGL